jgi:integrase
VRVRSFALRDSKVDLEDRALVVEASAYRGRASLTQTRNGRRRVYLSSVARRTIREQLLARKPNAEGLVFPSPTGCIWQKDNFMSRVFRPAVRRAGLDGLTFHDLRHTCASLMIARAPIRWRSRPSWGTRTRGWFCSVMATSIPGASERAAQRLDAVTSGAGVGEAWGEA